MGILQPETAADAAAALTSDSQPTLAENQTESVTPEEPSEETQPTPSEEG